MKLRTLLLLLALPLFSLSQECAVSDDLPNFQAGRLMSNPFPCGATFRWKIWVVRTSFGIGGVIDEQTNVYGNPISLESVEQTILNHLNESFNWESSIDEYSPASYFDMSPFGGPISFISDPSGIEYLDSDLAYYSGDSDDLFAAAHDCEAINIYLLDSQVESAHYAIGLSGLTDISAIVLATSPVGINGFESSASVARWDGMQWHGMGVDEFESMDDLILHNDLLLVYGSFSSFGGVEDLDGVAAWDGNQWIHVGGGFGGGIESFCVFQDTLLIAGSFYNSSDGDAVPGLAYMMMNMKPIFFMVAPILQLMT